jgi:hypothetical protein
MFLPAFFLASNVCKCMYKCTNVPWKDKASWHLTTMFTVRKARDIYCFHQLDFRLSHRGRRLESWSWLASCPGEGRRIDNYTVDGSLKRVSGTGCSIAWADQLWAYFNSSCRNAAFVLYYKTYSLTPRMACKESTLGYSCRPFIWSQLFPSAYQSPYL